MPKRMRSPLSRDEGPGARDEPRGQRGLQELLGDERARARAEPRTGVRARPNVVEPCNRRLVSRLRGKRAPEEVLVEGERARVRVAVSEVDVRGLEIGRRQDDSCTNRRLEVR